MRHCVPWLAIFLTALSSFGATRTASVSGNWNSTTTWGGSAVPTSSDDVVGNDSVIVTCDISASCVAKTISCANSNGTFTLNGDPGAVLTYYGNVAMCANNWTFSHGFAFHHNNNGTTSNHYTWAQDHAGKLILNGTAGSHITWDSLGSGYAGGLGGNFGYLKGSYVDFTDVGAATGHTFYQIDLSGSGAEWSCANCTFTNFGYILISTNAWDGASTFSVTDSTGTNQYDDGACTGFAIRGMDTKTGGTRQFTGNRWSAAGQIILQARSSAEDVGLTISDLFTYVNSSTCRAIGIGNTGAEPSFASGNWQNVFAWLYNPTNPNSNSAMDYPGGVIKRTKVMLSTYLDCPTQYTSTNYHVSNLNSGVPTKLDTIDIETDCSDDGPSNDLIEFFLGAVAAPGIEVVNSFDLPAPPHGSQGAFMSYQSSSGTAPALKFHNNNVVATGVSPSGTSCALGVETGAGTADVYDDSYDNIFYQVSSTYGVGCGAEGNSTSVANLYKTADHNAFSSEITGSHYRNSGSIFTNAPGTADQTGDPLFGNLSMSTWYSAHNFGVLKFCQSINPLIADLPQCITNFMARTPGITPAAAIDYDIAAQQPFASFIATMSRSGSYAGAVSPPSGPATQAILTGKAKMKGKSRTRP